jgi:hypothetical protein
LKQRIASIGKRRIKEIQICPAGFLSSSSAGFFPTSSTTAAPIFLRWRRRQGSRDCAGKEGKVLGATSRWLGSDERIGAKGGDEWIGRRAATSGVRAALGGDERGEQSGGVPYHCVSTS